jgi:hypothetical protein
MLTLLEVETGPAEEEYAIRKGNSGCHDNIEEG